MIDEHDFCADIGADHGKLVLFLGNKYKNSTFLAVENKIGPFNILKNAVETHSFNKNVECSFSDGIEYLKDDTNTLIFAGMGGFNVIDIIKKDYKNLKNIRKIVICVNKKVAELLDFLFNLGFRVTKYDAVDDAGKIYMIFSLILIENKDNYSYTDSISYVKKALIEANLYEEYIKKLILNNEREQKSKINELDYEYSDAYLHNLLIKS